MPETRQHDPDERVDYACDWTAELDPGETITAVTWSSRDAAGVTTLEPVAGSAASGRPAVFVGTTRTRGMLAITCHVTTSTGRILDDTFYLRLAHR